MGLYPALPKGATPSWTRGGIRSEVSKARVLTYAHGELLSGTGLKRLANEFLHALLSERGPGSTRPLFLICHSVGGLVVKLAMTEASRNPKYQNILEHCYGITFFGQEVPE